MAKSGNNAGSSEQASRIANQNSRNTGNIFAQLEAQHFCVAS